MMMMEFSLSKYNLAWNKKRKQLVKIADILKNAYVE